MPQTAHEPRRTPALYRWLLIALAVFLALGLYFLIAGLTLGDAPMRDVLLAGTQT